MISLLNIFIFATIGGIIGSVLMNRYLTGGWFRYR